MSALRDWVKLPTKWIHENGLTKLRWAESEGANNVAALMLLAVIAHHVDDDSGTTTLTYDQLSTLTALSRVKISGGLKVLEALGVVSRRTSGRSSLALVGYDKNAGWGKIPARRLYSHGTITFFNELSLRKASELYALKLYFLFVAHRNNNTNLAHISYDKIEGYTGIDRSRIKSGLSLLAANGLVHVEHLPSQGSEFGISNAYRLAHLEPYSHMGTQGRRLTEITEISIMEDLEA